jgi:hypothetical protein
MDSNIYVLLWNLAPAGEHVLAPGVTLRPLNRKITVFDLAAAGAVGFREWATLEPMVDRCHCEIESAKDAAVPPGYDTLNRAWLANCLFVLRGSGAFLPVAHSAYSWDIVAGAAGRLKEPPGQGTPRFTGRLLEDYRVRFLLCDSVSKHTITADDAEWVRNHYEKFEKLVVRSQRFRFALEASVDWKYAHDIRSAIARIWSGIEALLGISVEIVYRLSITCASILKPRGPERLAYFESVKKLYGVRSKAVHGDQISEEKLNAGLNESFVLLRDLLLALGDRGQDFDDASIKEAIMS